MKTLQQVTKEITSLAIELDEAQRLGEEKTARKLQSQIEQLRFFRLYLETNPRPEAVEKMRQDIEKRISILNERFGTWSAGKGEDQKVLLARYNSMVNMSELKSKLKALNYLCE